MGLQTILHPTDFSDGARQALIQAVRLAARHRAALHIFHGVLLHAEDPVTTERQLQQYLQEAERALPEGRDRANLKITISSGRAVSAFDAIMEKARELGPDLIVLGTHGRSGLGKFLMGSEAEKVLRHAPGSVMTLRADARVGGADGRFRRVIVPVDFSEHSRHALEAARGLAEGASLTLLHVIGPLPPMYYAAGLTSRVHVDPDLPGRVSARLREWAGDTAAETIVGEGQPAEEILRAAEETQADLIAMGTRGLTGLEHVMVGSVTERVCRRAGCPVLAVK
jgi:nucleotide-binding universal stress UspA family protein